MVTHDSSRQPFLHRFTTTSRLSPLTPSPLSVLASNGRVDPCDVSATLNFLFQRRFATLTTLS